MRALLIILVLLDLGACRKEPRGAAPPVENRVDAGASRPSADAAPDATCYEACMKRNQMRAIGIDQIERDCRAECTTPPPCA